MSGEEPGKDGASDPEPRSTYLAAVQSLRSVVRQGITAFAAVAAVLVGTSPLTNLGKLAAFDQRWWVAMSAAGLALLAVAVLIAAASFVLMPTEVRLDRLSEGVETDLIATHVLAGSGHTQPAELAKELREKDAERREVYEKLETSPRDERAELGKTLARLDARLDAIGPIAAKARELALWATVSWHWRTWVAPLVLVAALIAGGAIVTYAWAANPPATASVVAPQAVRVNVVIAQPDEHPFGTLLGAACADGFQAIALSRSDETFDVVVADDRCPSPLRLQVTRGNGIEVLRAETVVTD